MKVTTPGIGEGLLGTQCFGEQCAGIDARSQEVRACFRDEDDGSCLGWVGLGRLTKARVLLLVMKWARCREDVRFTTSSCVQFAEHQQQGLLSVLLSAQ